MFNFSYFINTVLELFTILNSYFIFNSITCIYTCLNKQCYVFLVLSIKTKQKISQKLNRVSFMKKKIKSYKFKFLV